MAPKIIIPVNATELEEMLNKPAQMKDVLADPESMREFIRNYAATVAQKDPGLNEQLRDLVKAEMSEFFRENGPAINARTNQNLRSLRNSQYREDAPGAALDPHFRNSCDFYKAIWHLNTGADNQQRLMNARNAFSSNVPASGGFLVPESVRSELMQRTLEASIVRPRAMVIPMEAPRVSFPIVDDTTHVGSVMGGLTTYWTAEGGQLTDTSTTFGQVTLDANTLTAYTEIPNQLLQDSAASLDAFVNKNFPLAMAFAEDTAFLQGSGVGQPKGVLLAEALIEVAKQSGQIAATVVWQNIVKMYARMLPSSLASAVWVCSPATFVELATMALSVGTGGSAIWLNNGVEGPPMTILGRPLYMTEKVPNLGTKGDIGFYDFGQYLVGDRGYMEAMSSPHYKFQNVKTAYRFVQRVDGRPGISSALTPANGGDTLSPFITLATRA